jgi:hypothetical protein
MTQLSVSQQQYSYSNAPHAAPAVTKGKAKYRNESEENEKISNNLMSDARVSRGNTYSTSKPSSGQSKQFGPGRTRKPSARYQGTSATMMMNTADYLEELTDQPIEQDTTTEVQAQPFVDRPASPLFVRANIGYDVWTQVEKGDLFDFDLEVEPILEVLVGRTLHVSMLEIQQEDELAAICAQQEEFEMIRNVEIAEVQRLEAELKRKAQEKERRITQEKKRVEDGKKLEESVAARQASSAFLNDLHVSVFEALEEQGEFYDPVKKEIEELVSTSLTGSILNLANIYEVASQMAWELLGSAESEAIRFENEAVSRREKQRQVEEEKRRKEEEERKRIEEEKRLAEIAAKKAEEEGENAGEV